MLSEVLLTRFVDGLTPRHHLSSCFTSEAIRAAISLKFLCTDRTSLALCSTAAIDREHRQRKKTNYCCFPIISYIPIICLIFLHVIHLEKIFFFTPSRAKTRMNDCDSALSLTSRLFEVPHPGGEEILL